MGKKILLADDEEDIIKLVSSRLKHWGYEVLIARDGKEALDFIHQEKPDLVLLDITMPVLDGIEVSRRVKSDKTLKNISIILLTASTRASSPEVLKVSQADDYIIKPFESALLLEKIKRLIG